LIPLLNAFKITTFPLLEHRSTMTGCSFNNCIRYRNTKTRQAYVATSRLSVSMPIVLPIQLFSLSSAKTKAQLELICQIFHFVYRIQQITLFRMVLKRLKLPQFLMVWHEPLFHTSVGVRRGTRI